MENISQKMPRNHFTAQSPFRPSEAHLNLIFSAKNGPKDPEKNPEYRKYVKKNMDYKFHHIFHPVLQRHIHETNLRIQW